MARVRNLKAEINNEFYDTLGERWYTAQDDPIALLRAEAKIKNPWVLAEISLRLKNRNCSVLDLGCGAGFLTHSLSRAGHHTVAIDLSNDSLEVARRHQPNSDAEFRQMDAHRLQFADATFDAVCAMDFLEHVSDPSAIIREAARVLKPGGLFFFHTFNRNPLSWLIVIKGVEWVFSKTPRNMHIYSLFIKPRELRHWCLQAGLVDCEILGLRPRILRTSFLKLMFKGEVSDDFQFQLSSSTILGYIGIAVKKP